METSAQTPEDASAVHTRFIQRCIRIARRYGSDLALGDHESLRELPRDEYPPQTTVGKRYAVRMPHLPFANRWLYTAYNEQGTNLIRYTGDHHEHAPIGEVCLTHMSMGRPTATSVSYELSDNGRVYAHAAVDSEQPPTPSVRAFMEQVGVPVHELGWSDPRPYHNETWDSPGPLSAIHVLAIMRVVNSHFKEADTP